MSNCRRKKDGEKLTGIMSSETSSAITLNQLSGQHITIPGTKIKTMETAEYLQCPGLKLLYQKNSWPVCSHS
ncbi:MAG: hypothetical protein ABIO76_07395 [Ginsengibacter sp.]